MNFLAGRSELRNAALIASKFKIDPWEVLNSTQFKWAVRQAAFQYISKLEKEESDKMKSQARKKK